MTDTDRDRIVELMELVFASAKAERWGDDRTRREIETRDARNEHRAISARLLAAFAAQRGWKVTEKRFYIAPLITGRAQDYQQWNDHQRGHRSRSTDPHDPVVPPGFKAIDELVDHMDCFRMPRSPYRPVALLSHSYETDRDQHLAAAKRHGLAVEFLDWSWYYPERCIAALYIRQ